MSAQFVRKRHRSSLLLLAVIVALTASLALAWSHHKLLNQDEMFVLQTDSVPTAAQLLNIQLHTPISLDPAVYHLLVHAVVRLFGATAFALRLPSLLGYLLMQVCLFVYVRRAAGDRAALIAAALPALTATLVYAAEARPYGLLLGLYGVALVAYQSATRSVDVASQDSQRAGSRSRTAALIALGLAIALTLNTHYFGILLLLPVYAAELTRTIARRKLDLAVIAGILAGTVSFVFTLPFQRAAAEYRKHYYNLANVGPRAITQAYRSLLVDYTQTSLHTQRLIAITFVLLAICFLGALPLRWRTFHLPPGEAAFLLMLAAQPFCGFFLAFFVTHTIEVRYVLGTILAIVVLVALLVAPLLERRPVFAVSLAVVLVGIIIGGCLRIDAETHKSSSILASLEIPAELQTALDTNPDRRLYFQEVGHYEIAQYYAPAAVRDRIALVYSVQREIRFDRHDTESLTAENLAHFSALPIVPYNQLLADPWPHIFALYHGGWDWTDQALAEDHAVVKPVTPWFDGQASLVTFPQSLP
jgi:hypothetical protein